MWQFARRLSPQRNERRIAGNGIIARYGTRLFVVQRGKGLFRLAGLTGAKTAWRRPSVPRDRCSYPWCSYRAYRIATVRLLLPRPARPCIPNTKNIRGGNRTGVGTSPRKEHRTPPRSRGIAPWIRSRNFGPRLPNRRLLVTVGEAPVTSFPDLFTPRRRFANAAATGPAVTDAPVPASFAFRRKN